MLEQPRYLPRLRDVHFERVWPCGERARLRPGPPCGCDVPRVPDDILDAADWKAQLDAWLQAHPSHHHPDSDEVVRAWSRPGVYVLIDREDQQPRYVGQTVNLRRRLGQWFLYTYRSRQRDLQNVDTALTPVIDWLARVRKSPLVWTPWLPTQGWSRERHRTWYVESRLWETRVEPWLSEQLLRAEARAIAHFRTQGAPLLNVRLEERFLDSSV